MYSGSRTLHLTSHGVALCGAAGIASPTAGNDGNYEPISQEGGQDASAYTELNEGQKYSGPNGTGGQGPYQNVNDGGTYVGLGGGQKYGGLTDTAGPSVEGYAEMDI